MDMKPTPLNSLPGISVPLLDIIPYDRKGLEEFPERCGISKEQLVDTKESPKLIASVLQSWLYFGLLSEIFQTSLNPDDFTCHTGGPDSSPQISLASARAYIDKASHPKDVSKTEMDR